MPTALVTGANRGIGLELVRQLLGRDYEVHATYRTSKGGLEGLACSQLHEHQLDVRDEEAVKAMMASIDTPLDVLINNAGVADGRWSSVEEIDMDVVREVLDINAVAPLLVTQCALPLLTKNGGKVAIGKKRIAFEVNTEARAGFDEVGDEKKDQARRKKPHRGLSHAHRTHADGDGGEKAKLRIVNRQALANVRIELAHHAKTHHKANVWTMLPTHVKNRQTPSYRSSIVETTRDDVRQTSLLEYRRLHERLAFKCKSWNIPPSGLVSWCECIILVDVALRERTSLFSPQQPLPFP